MLIMWKDTPVARYTTHGLEILNTELAPLALTLRKVSPSEWLRNRSMEIQRASYRLYKKRLGLTVSSQEQVLEQTYARRVTDNYWVKRDEDVTTFSQIKLVDDLSEIILAGEMSYSTLKGVTPELTLNGVLEKGWKKINDEWYLFKISDKERSFYEVLASRLIAFSGIFPTVLYNPIRFVRNNSYGTWCKDFTNHGEVEFIPMWDLIGDEEDFLQNIRVLNGLGVPTEEFVKLILADILISNPDRHTNNYGVVKTADGYKLAWSYDYDMALSVTSKKVPSATSRTLLVLLEHVVEIEKYNIKITKEIVDVIVDTTARDCGYTDYVKQAKELINSNVELLGWR